MEIKIPTFPIWTDVWDAKDNINNIPIGRKKL